VYVVGDHVLLEASDLSHIAAPQYVSVCTLSVSGQLSAESERVYLTSQLSRSTHTPPADVSVPLNGIQTRNVTRMLH